MVPWFRRSMIPKIYSACSFTDVMYSSWKLFCFVPFAHTQSTSGSKSAYFCLPHMHNASKTNFSKFRHKSFGYSGEKSERPCLMFFHEWKNLELLRGYPDFRNALLILMIFQNKYRRAITIGMRVHILLHYMTQGRIPFRQTLFSQNFAQAKFFVCVLCVWGFFFLGGGVGVTECAWIWVCVCAHACTVLLVVTFFYKESLLGRSDRVWWSKPLCLKRVSRYFSTNNNAHNSTVT